MNIFEFFWFIISHSPNEIQTFLNNLDYIQESTYFIYFATYIAIIIITICIFLLIFAPKSKKNKSHKNPNYQYFNNK
jgi:hypothetical protein